MLGLGILFAGATICTFLAAICGIEEYKRLFVFLCGVFLILSVNVFFPFLEEINHENIMLKTKKEAVVEKEIFINTVGKTDTTYYYTFEKCTTIRKD